MKNRQCDRLALIERSIMETTEVEVVDMPMELSVFDPIDVKLAEAKEKNANLAFDYHDRQGNKDARSWVAHLRTFKAPVNEMHKTGKATAMKYCKEWDTAKNKRITAIEEMIEHHHKPIREIEEAEAKKKADEEARIKAEEEAMEAERLAEIEAREKAVQEEREALEKEKAEIERKAREARVALEARRKAEADAKQALVDAENRRLADIQRVKDEAAEKERQAREKAEEERQRAEEQAEMKAFEETARINDEKHRSQIHREIYLHLLNAFAMDKVLAEAITRELIDGKIPHVNIEY